eukprot:Seg3958.3 transcript_id=Seg3958.3/GoldUCD/mRNA.D3Y31 product="hypothetical protein" pseudo=true protein_id=Seg3958.3/GoldUCD/D3Y31
MTGLPIDFEVLSNFCLNERWSTSILCAFPILPFDCSSHFHMTSYIAVLSKARPQRMLVDRRSLNVKLPVKNHPPNSWISGKPNMHPIAQTILKEAPMQWKLNVLYVCGTDLFKSTSYAMSQC